MTARLAVAVLCSLIAASSAWAADPPNAADLEAELVCPVCETTLDQSNAPVAERMKVFIRERIEAGDSEQEIKDALVAEFGTGVLATPGKSGFGLLAWVIPLAALAVGALALGLLVRSWSRRRADSSPGSSPGASPGPSAEPALDPAMERRLDEELARFDA